MQILAGAPDPEWEMTLEIASIRVTAERVEATIGFEPLLGRRAVRPRYDAGTAPGLF